ncbi:MAG TPA: malto-oligosyltrehalose trehalohydrolase [Burkholderiales bacterium]|nr:malto-oligosyltrehalose trehalohydrolase [Burkholderiales bacterium]
MIRCHDMPFGAAIREDGATRFRLWAPAARRVDLVLATDRVKLDFPMRAQEAGWREALVEGAPAGARYGFRIDGEVVVPDPASRFNPDDVHAPSAVVDPLAFDWQDHAWRGLPWEEAVLYELHVGAFTPAGTFDAAIERFDYLADLGVTAIELMPVADFPGKRNWGYDGVLPFAPDASYGTPEALKRLVQAAHARGLMALLDVVYNHFGPEGNYLHLYAPQFFNPRHRTPWGAAVNFDGEHARTVRDFFIHNALYWLEEYRFDGLRLDAVHAIADDSEPDIVSEIAAAIRSGPGRDRHVHLVLENDRNEARYLARDAVHRPICATAQWNDDAHHAAHVLATGERDGYYADYASKPLWHLGRCLAEGFAYQGERSPYRAGSPRGEPCAHLPATAFVNFLQTHDQVGNRAFGERLGAIAKPQALDALAACVLLAPSPPLLFMGEEFGTSTPFLFFCDFGPALAEAVTKGRREEFARFERFCDPQALDRIPDPNAPETFQRSKVAWVELERAGHRERFARYRQLLAVRREHIAPRLAQLGSGGRFDVRAPGILRVDWALDATARLHLLANLCDEPAFDVRPPPGRLLHVHGPGRGSPLAAETLDAWGVVWTIEA